MTVLYASSSWLLQASSLAGRSSLGIGTADKRLMRIWFYSMRLRRKPLHKGGAVDISGRTCVPPGSSRRTGRGIALELAQKRVKVALRDCENEAAAKHTLAKTPRAARFSQSASLGVCRSKGDVVTGIPGFSAQRSSFGLSVLRKCAAPPGSPVTG